MRPTRKIKTHMLSRVATVETRADGAPALDPDARTVEVSFSSEEPVERFFGAEILDHAPGSVDLSRMLDGRAPVLVDHSSRDQVGVVVSAEIGDDRRGHAVLRFGRSARAEEILQDIADGIRSQVSVGYRVRRAVLEETSEEDGDVFRVVDWQPLEVSIVALAADPTVGVGRSATEPGSAAPFETVLELAEREDAGEDDMTIQTRSDPATQPSTPATQPAVTLEPRRVSDAELAQMRAQAAEREGTRAAEILAVASRWNCREEGLEAINAGRSAAEFKGWVLENKIPKGQPLETPSSALGMGRADLAGYSLRRAILAMATGNWRGAELEFEASNAVEKAVGRDARGFFVPWDVLEQRIEVPGLMARAAVAKGGSGANLIATDLMPQAFIEILRNRMQVRAAGATILPGLVGDVAIPRRTGAASSAWVAEGAGSGDSPQVYDQVLLAAKTVRARSDMTRKMLLQSSPAIEQLTREDLAIVLALAIDAAATFGSASGAEPRGIVNVVGIGSVAVGTNGGAPTWAHVVNLETEVAADNADVGTLAYMTNARVRGKLKQTEKATGSGIMVWGDGVEATVNGYRSLVSNQVPSNLTKGSGTNLSAMLFGNWRDLLIGEWGTLDVTAENVTLADSGGVSVRAFMDVDVAVRHPESFAAATDFVTT